jgi:predicted Rossmann-fold nucleotide-binding protein
VIDELLRPLTVRDPAVAPLAVVASLAVELQPGLLRRLRRRLVPEASPLTEALLWSSELAGSRTASTLLLADDVQVELRRRLASDQLLLDAARAVIVEAHVGVAEILRCEEDLVYYGLVDLARLPRADLDQATLENRIRDRLEQVLGSIVADPARRQYLLAWSTRALPGLPERVQTHEAGGLLARYIAGERVGAVLAPSDRDAAIGVRWTAAGLLLSARDRAPTTLRVPPIQPLLVEITLERDGPWSEPQRVVVPAQDALTVPLEDQVTRVRLRSLRGDGLVLHRQPATATTPSRLWVLVAGAAADDIPAVERRAADTLGRAIGAHGIGLITGAFVGIDQITAEAFLSVASVGQLVSVVREGRTPSVSAGIVRLVASDLDEYWEAVVRADGVVVLSDTAGTREVARLATLAGRPVFAYPGTPAANLPGVAPIPKDVAMHAGIAAEGILRSISQRRATPSPLSRWAGPALLAAAIDCLRVNPDQAASRIDRLWDAVRNRDAPDDAILDDTIARHPAPERLLHYILLQHRLIRRATTARDARWFEPLVDAIVEETAFASEFQEARLLWQGLLALHDHLGHSPAETLRLDLELRLQAVEDRLQQFPSGETRDACARLFTDILARFADNPLRNFAGRYEHIRATEPSSDDRASALDILMLDARRTATELGVRAEHITGLYKSGRAGLRVVALACCAALPDQAPHDVILDTLAEPATRFELWTAVTAAAAVLAVEPPGTTEPIAAALLALQGPSNNPTRARRNGSTLRHASVALANYAGQIGLTDDTDLVALRLWLAAAGPRRDRGTVVVIGSSTTPDDVPFCSALGARLASHGWRLVSGRGYNVGPHVVAGYRRAEGPGFAIYSTSALDGDPPETRVFDRLEDARVQMVAAADCGIVIRGGDGTRIECELALAKPMPLLALPFTGGTAARIADTTRGHLADLGLPPPILGLLERDDRLPADEQAERTVRLLDIVLRRWSELRPPRSRRPTSTANKPRPRESLEGDLRRMPLPPRIVASRTIPRMLPEPPEELVGPLRAGQVVAVVGSGLSCAAGYPSWTGLLQGVCDEALRLCPSERPRIASAWNAIDRDSIGAAGLLLDVLGTQFPAVVISQLNRRRKLVARAPPP